jgi:hypothetical protein
MINGLGLSVFIRVILYFVGYLHSLEIQHILKPDCVFIDGNIYKIGNYDISRFDNSQDGKRVVSYLSPEVLNGKKYVFFLFL